MTQRAVLLGVPAALLCTALLLANCTLINQRETPPPPDELRTLLETRLIETRGAQTAALALWDRIIFGETVSCQETITVPATPVLTARERGHYPQTDAIAHQLDAAIAALADSSDTWNSECANPRGIVPLEVARAGRNHALAAGPPLDEAARLLAAWANITKIVDYSRNNIHG